MLAICDILDSVEETSDDINIVEYECLGNNTNYPYLINYKLCD